ncbi:hypothetical protein BUALT_Bualt17G0017100 [Buddleja alternifolia]|uniref:Bifunctional inhibitor/plant lipid transfer protein/seed storage helical domain-containing protein n=1 Tax=Buddleja alternifolia TaxID=168488 RepID=A0AAV6WBQ4_9LAMI|nr:hypothetical protein BUALT_Bualt17G0017100 [Buddleja alternifolia]
MEEEKKKMSTVILGSALCFLVVGAAAATDATLSQKCLAQFQKVAMCLPFVTEKAPAPTKDCCAAATDLKDTDPACLCYIVQQIHNGSSQAIKSMGIQESRLLQLPSACKLANASVAECPRLLHLAPNSPDAAIFTNTTSAAATTSPGTGTPSLMPASNGFWHNPQLRASLFIATSIFFVAFPPGLLSM